MNRFNVPPFIFCVNNKFLIYEKGSKMMEQFEHLTRSAQETMELGGRCMEEALKAAKPDVPLIFYLEGELGAGKTHFIKGAAKALGIKGNITSPTFVLMKKYGISKRGKTLFFHIDCYRIDDSAGACQIGLDETLKIPRAIIAIEWAERIADIIPRPYWEIKIGHVDDTIRRITVKNVQR